jgi:hypothetical protein
MKVAGINSWHIPVFINQNISTASWRKKDQL